MFSHFHFQNQGYPSLNQTTSTIFVINIGMSEHPLPTLQYIYPSPLVLQSKDHSFIYIVWGYTNHSTENMLKKHSLPRKSTVSVYLAPGNIKHTWDWLWRSPINWRNGSTYSHNWIWHVILCVNQHPWFKDLITILLFFSIPVGEFSDLCVHFGYLTNINGVLTYGKGIRPLTMLETSELLVSSLCSLFKLLKQLFATSTHHNIF